MKNLYRIISVALASGALLLSGCAKEELGNDKVALGDTRTVTIPATTTDMVPADDETKAGYLDGTGLQWHSGDRISLFARKGPTGTTNIHNNLEFAVHCSSFPAKNANFVGTWEEPQDTPTFYVAYYPYAEHMNMDNYANTLKGITFPSVQYYTTDENGNQSVDGLPMIARGQVVTTDDVPVLKDGTLKFYPLTALYRIPIKLKAGETENVIVEKLTLITNGSDYLSGTASALSVANLTAAGFSSPPNMSWESSNRSKSVVLDCGDGVPLSTDQEAVFFIAIPKAYSTSYSSGFKLKIETNTGISVISTKTSAINVTPGKIYRLPLLEIEAPAAPDVVKIPDALLRNALVNMGMINDLNDGEGNVELLDTKLPNPTLNLQNISAAITDLTGLHYFTNLTSLTISTLKAGTVDLRGCAELTTLTATNMPNLKTLNVSGCTKLKTVNASGTNILETLDISGCTALTTLNVGATASTPLVSGKTIMFEYVTSITYKPNLKTLKADGLTQIEKVSAVANAGKDVTITNISLKDCTALASMVLAQTTPINIDVTGCTLLTADKVTGHNDKVTFTGLNPAPTPDPDPEQ